MSKPLRILLLEDRPADAELVTRELRKAGFEFVVKQATTENEFLAELRNSAPQVILADYSLPTYDGLSALAAAQKQCPETPFIFVSGSMGEEKAIETLHRGATDYVLKDRLARLGPAVHRALREQEEIQKGRQSEQLIRELNLVLRATGAINALMVRERDPKRLLAEACKILVETRGYQFAWIGQVEPSSKRVVPAARAGKHADYLDTATITWDETPTGQGPIGTAIRTGQPVTCQDTATDPRFAPWRAAAMARGFASVAAMPMIHGVRVLGAVAVYSERPGAFNAEELNLLKELAGDLAFALQSIEHEQERKRAELRTTAFAGLGQRLSAANTAREAGEIIVDVADKLLGWDACLFDLYSAAENRITHVLNMDLVEGRRTECKQRYPDPAPRTLSKQAIEQGGQLILRDQPESIRPEGSPFGDTSRPSASIMFVPVRHRTKVVGVLSIQSYTPRAYDAYSLETLQALADHGGGALERLRAQEALGENEATFRSVWECSVDGMRLTDKEGRITAVNEAFCRLVKLPREKLEGHIFSVAYKGHAPDEGIEVYHKRFSTGGISPLITRPVQLWNSDEVDLEISNSFIELGQRGKVLLSLFRDVSERKRAESRIAAFSTLGQRLSAAKTAREAAGIISEVAGELLGWDACLFGLLSPSRDLLDLVLNVDTIDGRRVENSPGYQPPPVLARRAIEAGGQLILKEEPDQMVPGAQPFGDATHPSASIMYVPVRKGTEVIGVMSIQSYTPGAYDARSLETLQALADHCGGALDRLRMEEALGESEANFRSVWERSIDGMRLTDKEGRIIAVNEAFCQLVKLPREKLEGQFFSVAYTGQGPSGSIEIYRQRFSTTDLVPRITARVQLWNGEEVDLEISNSFLELGRRGKLLLGIFRDVSERQRAELRIAAFASLGQRLNAAKNAREAAGIIVEVADELLGWDSCVFDLYSAAENQMSHLLSMDLIDGRRTECKPLRVHQPPTEHLRRTIEQGGQLTLRDRAEPIRPENLPFGDTSRPSASLMFVPVRHGTEVVGILSIQSYTPKAYDAYSLETLQALADHGGGALERLRAQEALSESEANFRSVWERSVDGMRLIDKEGRIIAVNEAFCQLVKLPREKLEGQMFSVAYKKHGRSDGIEVYQKRFAAGDIDPHTTPQVQLWNSGELDLEVSSSFIELGQRGKMLLGIFRDVSERKRVELRVEAFSKLGQRLSAAKTAREAAVIISEVAGDLLGWDACFFGLLSPGRDLLDRVLNVDTIDGRREESSPGYEPVSAAARRAIEAGGQLFLNEKPNQRLLLRQLFGNSIRPSASMMFVPVRKGAEVVGVMSIKSHKPGAYDPRSLETLQALADHCNGALDRLRMEAACQTTQQRLGHLLMQSPAVIYSLSTDGKTTEPAWVSDNVERLLGYTAAECHGPDSLFDQLHPQDRQGAIDGFIRLLLNKQIARDYRVRHKNGEYRWVRDEQRLVCDAGGAPVEIVGSWVDITEQKAVEEQLRQSQKMEAVGQLAGGVAHDFNNMLAVIRGNAELLLMDAEQYPAGAREGLERVVEASARAANLTRQLLAFSRKQVLQPQPLVLNEVIANLTKMLRRLIGENINLQCLYATPLPHVQADTSMMEQVILNLVVNARDAMPEGGQLRVATEHVSFDEAHARVNPEARAGEFVCLLVSDTGTGIAPEVLPRIFEPFFTTKELGKGTGLGLATVYGIVQQHQGWIEVSSQVGEGSTFRVFLPAIPTPARPAAAAKAGAEIRGGKETILLVEDEPTVRLVTRRVLESKGYTIREATSAREALEVWQNHAAEIALLLTDIIMPEQMTGRVLAEQLWKQRPGLKVIFMSGYSAEVLGKGTEFIRRTRSHFLQKPCSSQALLETVRQSLDEQGSVAAVGGQMPAQLPKDTGSAAAL